VRQMSRLLGVCLMDKNSSMYNICNCYLLLGFEASIDCGGDPM